MEAKRTSLGPCIYACLRPVAVIVERKNYGDMHLLRATMIRSQRNKPLSIHTDPNDLNDLKLNFRHRKTANQLG